MPTLKYCFHLFDTLLYTALYRNCRSPLKLPSKLGQEPCSGVREAAPLRSPGLQSGPPADLQHSALQTLPAKGSHWSPGGRHTLSRVPPAQGERQTTPHPDENSMSEFLKAAWNEKTTNLLRTDQCSIVPLKSLQTILPLTFWYMLSFYFKLNVYFLSQRLFIVLFFLCVLQKKNDDAFLLTTL